MVLVGVAVILGARIVKPDLLGLELVLGGAPPTERWLFGHKNTPDRSYKAGYTGERSGCAAGCEETGDGDGLEVPRCHKCDLNGCSSLVLLVV